MWTALRALPIEQQIVLSIVAVASVFMTLYPLTYGLTAPWWRTTFGRAMLMFTTVLALVTDMTIVVSLNAIAGHPLGYRTNIALQIVAWSLVCISSAFMWGWLVAAQFRRPMRKRRADKRRAARHAGRQYR